MKMFIVALLFAISYAQTEVEAAGEVEVTVTGAAEMTEASEAPEVAEAGGEAPEVTEVGEAESGATTGEIPSMPSGSEATSTGSTGSTGMVLPCKMRMMSNCEGPSPMGGRCYLSEFTECEEAEAGDGDYMCVGLSMTACNAKSTFCWWDMSDVECTSAKEREYPILPNGILPKIPGITAPVDSTGAKPANPMASMMQCAQYTLGNLAACTMANGCYLDEEQCKPIAAKMAGIDPPEIERPEGMMPGMMPKLPGFGGAPLQKTQEKPAEDTSNKSNNIPHELIYGTAGFFGGILISVIIYFLTCGRSKHNSHRDVFLEEYSSREFPVV